MNALPHNADKATTATWMGYPSGLTGIAAMDAEHDDWHVRLCDWLGVRSHSMMVARGEPTTAPQRRLAEHEENAVLWLQRMIQHFRNEGEL